MSSGDRRDQANVSGGTAGLPAIEKLDGTSNYASWKFLMELYLVHDDLWEYTSVTPVVTDVQGTKKDQKARAKICLSVKPQCLVHVRSAKNSKEAWEALKNAFEDKGLNNRCRLLSRLVSLKLEQFMTVREYVTSVLTTAQELSDIGKEVDDELLAALLLQGLTQEFQPMRLAIENSNTQLTTDFVKTKLFQMEDAYVSGTSNSSALFSKKHKGKSQKTQKSKTYSIKCYICGGPHKAIACPDNPKSKKNALHAYGFAVAGKSAEEEWVLDSGASTHMSNRREWFKDYKMIDRVPVTCANGDCVYGEGKGMVDCKSLRLTVSDVMYVPKLETNLMSVSSIVKKHHVVVFSNKGCEIFKKGECEVRGEAVVRGIEERGVYKLKNCLQNAALTSTISDELSLWHKRMAHLGMRNLNLLKKIADGVSFPDSCTKLECPTCLMGKQTKQPFKKSCATRATEVLGLIHSDVCGPMREGSISGHRYFLTFIDDLTRKTFIYFMKQKSEVFELFKDFKSFVEKQTGCKVKILRTDNGKEFVNNQMEKFLKENGIQHQLSVEYTPEQNGVAERANRTICEKARCLLDEAGLEKIYWAEAVHHAVFLKNRSPTLAVKNVTPEEAWTKRKCDLSVVKVFGCKAFMHIPDQKRTKWSPKSKELLYMGYCDNSKAYRLIDPSTKKIFKAKDVVFFEKQKHKDSQIGSQDTIEIPFLEKSPANREPAATNMQHDEADRVPVETNNQDALQEIQLISTQEETEPSYEDCNETSSIQDNDNFMSAEEDNAENIRRYPLRVRTRKEFPDYYLYQVIESEDPTTVKEALSRKDSLKWKDAIQEELNALKKNNTWTLVKPPKKCNIVDSKWIFRIKDEGGNRSRYKARLVVRGFSQRYGIDYDETFSPVVRHSSLRVLLALATKSRLNVDQMDVKTAFLNGDLHETVFMKQPVGFEEKGKDYVCLLKKSIYGLKQAPRAWNHKLNTELIQLGFRRSINEPCVYTRSKGKKVIILAVYVDDMLIFWNNAEELQSVKRDLMSKFEMKDLGKAHLILGMNISQDDTGIKINQEKYVDKILKVFGMADCKVASTPLVFGEMLHNPGPEHKPDPRIPYQNLIGSLMYLSVCTRPDIAHSVNILSQFNSCYTEQHWTAAKRVLRYLKGTKSLGLKYSREEGMDKIQGFADASYASTFDRKSYTGVVFLWKGGAVSWECRKQRTVALSTAEAEYVAMSEAAREAIFLRRFIAEVTDTTEESVKIYSDSQSAIAIAQNPVHHQRTKHIDVRHHFVREAVEEGIIELKYVETTRMVADALTKPLLKGKFEWCVQHMGVV